MMPTNRVLAGVDGCRIGWVAVIESTGLLSTLVTTSMTELVDELDSNALIAIDIPIGLMDAGPRYCDVAARALLGAPRASSVFPAPNRAVLMARSYGEACSARQSLDGKKISQQAFAILPKIREADDLLCKTPELRGRVREVHPEVSFAIWNGGRPMTANKKSAAGATEREQLIERIWPGMRTELWGQLPRGAVKRDDLNDAFAALWTARRIDAGVARSLPEHRIRDSAGLAMEIVA